MKLFHLSDLHLGKRVNDYSMLEDQRFILKQILALVDTEEPSCVLLAGDIYDKPVPSTEAIELFDFFVAALASRGIRLLAISGNHDSPERLSFGHDIFKTQGIFFSPVYNGVTEPVILTDEYGDVCFYLLPFLKPVNVKRFFPDCEINSYTDALDLAIKNMNIDKGRRNILLTHQFVTGAERSDSEEISVGGSDNVDCSVLEGFDYVALGHIHKAQTAGAEHIRYSGTPLKYSFSEVSHTKSVTVVDIKEKGDIKIELLPLSPLRDMREIKGSYDELIQKSFYDGTSLQSDYIKIILTDELDVPDAAAKLRIAYKNLMKLEYDNTRTRHQAAELASTDDDNRAPLDFICELYEKQNGCGLTPEQSDYIISILEKLEEESL